MDDSHPFRSMSIGRPIPDIRLFECGQRARSYSRPSILLIRFIFISHQSVQTSWDPAVSKFELEISKVKVMRSKMKAIYYTQYSTDALSLRFTSIGPTVVVVVWGGVGWWVVVEGWSGWWVAWGWGDGGGYTSTKYIFVSGKFFMYSIIRGMVYYGLIVHVRSVASYVSP